jgi:hypothetical protein
LNRNLDNLKFILKFKKGRKKVISETDRIFLEDMSYEPSSRGYNNMGAQPMINQPGQQGQWGSQTYPQNQLQVPYPGQAAPYDMYQTQGPPQH